MLQFLGHTLGGGHLSDDEPIAVLRLLVQVGKVVVQLARQNQMVEQKRVNLS